MTASRIQQAALELFAQQGYEATSMTQIAEATGIKKPSIYAHFKSKEDLFLHVVQQVYENELDAIKALFLSQQTQALEVQLYSLLRGYVERYEQDPELKFMIRMSFFPPAALEKQVMTQVYVFLDQIEHKLVPFMRQAAQDGDIAKIEPEQAATAFMCLLDGIFVELLYGGKARSLRKLESAWYVYWRGLSLQN